MKKLVMDGLDMMEPEKEYVIGEMGGGCEGERVYCRRFAAAIFRQSNDMRKQRNGVKTERGA